MTWIKQHHTHPYACLQHLMDKGCSEYGNRPGSEAATAA